MKGRSLAPVSSPNDSKAYRFVELDNRMKVLLVSDPLAEKAAASLDVHVGSSSNPADRGGLAHFLEHMLFLGTDKYPDSGEYARFISEHGGSRNAYTGFEHTNYFFDIDWAHLEEALDRFGQFFISPRFDAEYVKREVNAVHAEYQLGLKTDARRNLDVLREVVNPEHPYSVLGVGTGDTLADRPGRPVRRELLAFYDRHYSAGLMALTVLGREPLDDLEAMVRGIFSPVPNRGAEVATIEAPLYRPGSLPMMVHIRPEASLRQLQLSFPIPDYRRLYRAKPMGYISNLIGHEGEGSLLSLLKAEGWAEALVAGGGISYRGGGAFSVSISLTETGMAARDQVLARFFEYIALLREKGPQKALYREQGQLAALDFRFRPDVQPVRYVAGLSSDIHLYRPEDVLRGAFVMEDFRPRLISGILARYITPDNVVVTVIGEGVPVDRQSLYYSTPYSVRSLPPGEGLAWRATPESMDSRLHLPEPNAFVAQDVELVDIAEDNPAVPRLVRDGGGLRAWFRQEDGFRVPKGAVYAGFRSSLASDTPAHAAAVQLYVFLLQDMVNEYTYPAYLAGLNVSLTAHRRGVNLKVSGYDDKQLALLGRMVNSIATADIDPRRFDSIRAELIRRLDSAGAERAFRQVVGTARQLLLSGTWDEEELIAELERLTQADMETHVAQFWASAELDLMLNGNYEPALLDAVEQALRPLTSLRRRVLPPTLKVVRLTPGPELTYRTDVEHDDAVLFWYIQAPGDSLEQQAMSALTGQIVRADYFEELRTEQQLGYVVSAFSWPQSRVPGVVFMVQSPVADAARIREATVSFLEGVGDPDALTPEQFELHRSALLAKILGPHTNIDQQSEHFWKEITEGWRGFDSREQLADAVRDLTLAGWREWFERHLLNGRAALAVVAPGARDVLPPGVPVPSRNSFKANHSAYERE